MPELALRVDMSTSEHSSWLGIPYSIVWLHSRDYAGQCVTMSRPRIHEGLVEKKEIKLSLA